MSQAQLEKMRTDLNLNEIKARLIAIPIELQSAQTAVYAIKIGLQEAEQVLKEREAELSFEVSMETNGDSGKSKFPNETMRKAELTRRLSVDTDYQQTLKVVQDKRGEVQSSELHIDRLRNDFRVVMVLKDLAVSEMNLLSGKE